MREVQQDLYPNILGTGIDISARVHTVTVETGVHTQEFVSVETFSPLDAARKASEISHDKRMAWVDFICRSVVRTIRDGQHETLYGKGYLYSETFLATKAENPYDFTTVNALLQRPSIPDYTTDWMRKFLQTDAPSAPIPRNKTAALAQIATRLPPMSEEDMIQLAIQKIPSIREHYEANGFDMSFIKPNEASRRRGRLLRGWFRRR